MNMSTQLLYNDFPTFLRKYFPYKVQKISLNAGFTCPNRDGTKGWGGWILFKRCEIRKGAQWLCAAGQNDGSNKVKRETRVRYF